MLFKPAVILVAILFIFSSHAYVEGKSEEEKGVEEKSVEEKSVEERPIEKKRVEDTLVEKTKNDWGEHLITVAKAGHSSVVGFAFDKVTDPGIRSHAIACVVEAGYLECAKEMIRRIRETDDLYVPFYSAVLNGKLDFVKVLGPHIKGAQSLADFVAEAKLSGHKEILEYLQVLFVREIVQAAWRGDFKTVGLMMEHVEPTRLWLVKLLEKMAVDPRRSHDVARVAEVGDAKCIRRMVAFLKDMDEVYLPFYAAALNGKLRTIKALGSYIKGAGWLVDCASEARLLGHTSIFDYIVTLLPRQILLAAWRGEVANVESLIYHIKDTPLVKDAFCGAAFYGHLPVVELLAPWVKDTKALERAARMAYGNQKVDRAQQQKVSKYIRDFAAEYNRDFARKLKEQLIR